VVVVTKGRRVLVGKEPVVSLPSARAFPCNQRGRRAISVSPVAIIMRPVAMIVGPSRQIPCNDSGRKPPMIAIPDTDDCGSLHVAVELRKHTEPANFDLAPEERPPRLIV
jgi:hypothetical protein